jgi:hypothetical protein
MRILIGLYLSAVLGQKPRLAAINIHKIGCGCPECSALDRFLMTEKVRERYPLRQDRRTHLERQALKAPDLITFRTECSGSPYTLVVTKTPETVAILQRQTRQMEAKTFLPTIGDENMIAKVMGARYEGVGRYSDVYDEAARDRAGKQRTVRNNLKRQTNANETVTGWCPLQ